MHQLIDQWRQNINEIETEQPSCHFKNGGNFDLNAITAISAQYWQSQIGFSENKL